MCFDNSKMLRLAGFKTVNVRKRRIEENLVDLIDLNDRIMTEEQPRKFDPYTVLYEVGGMKYLSENDVNVNDTKSRRDSVLSSRTSVFSDIDPDYDLNVNMNAGDEKDEMKEGEKEDVHDEEQPEAKKLKLWEELERTIYLEEAANELELEERLKVERVYPYSTLKPCMKGILGHKEQLYLENLLSRRETTIYVVGKEEIWVSAQVMARIIVNGEFEVVNRVKQDGMKERILCPLSYEAVNRATQYLCNLPENTQVMKLLKMFPFWALQYDLPVLDLPDELHSFFNWSPPAPPTQDDWKVFKYAPSNFRFQKTTFAANCRHPITMWDEHPWCGLCLANAGIQICAAYDEQKTSALLKCYICSRMTESQIKAFRKSFEEWSVKVRVHQRKNVKTRKISDIFHCQIHCDFASVNVKEENPAWRDKKFGFCRPGWCIPYYYCSDEFEQLSVSSMKKQASVHSDLMEQMYRAAEMALSKEDAENWTMMAVLKPARTSLRNILPPNFNEDLHDEFEEEKKDDVKEETKKEKPEVRLLKNKPGPASSKQWSCDYDWLPYQSMNGSESYDYSNAIDACCDLRNKPSLKVMKQEEEDKVGTSDDDSFMTCRSIAKKTKVEFKPNERMNDKMNDCLKLYNNEAAIPRFRAMKVSMNDYPDSKVAKEVPKVCADKTGKYPRDDDTLSVYQTEIMRLESMNRALVKIHESDDFLMTALFKQLAKKGDVNEIHVVNAIKTNFSLREDLIAESSAICLAARRRDNAKRVGQRSDRLAATVSRAQDAGDALLPYEKSTAKSGRSSSVV